MKKITATRNLCLVFFALCGIALNGCASPVGAIASVASAALEMAGMKKAELPESQKPPKTVKLRLYAAENLNSGTSASSKGMALVIKVYKLRGVTAFNQMNSAIPMNTKAESDLLGQDLVNAREIVLIPGQKYEIEEKVPYEAGFVGIAGMFRNAAAGRWKYAFQSSEAEKSGLTLGVHSCAFSVTVGTPLATDGDQQLLSNSKCS